MPRPIAFDAGDALWQNETCFRMTEKRFTELFFDHGEHQLIAGRLLEAGGWGVHVPHELTWVLEHVDAPEDNPRFRRLEHLGALLPLLGQIA